MFLRHAHSMANDQGVLSGRLPGISLSKSGFTQAESLIERLGASSFDEILVSPMERCSQTISPWLQSKYSKGVGEYRLEDNLNEVDYGLWSGRKLSKLSKDPLWKVIQSTPSKVQFPEGERIKAAQKRALTSIHEAHAKKKSGSYLFVSHGDIIKSTIAALIGLPLDSFQNLIAPVLIIGTTRDPATPYEWAFNLSKKFINSSFLTLDADGHTGQNRGIPCIENAVLSFLTKNKSQSDTITCHK